MSLRPARRRWWQPSSEGGEACLPVEIYRVGGRKTVGNPPADPTPEDSHRGKNGGGRLPYS